MHATERFVLSFAALFPLVVCRARCRWQFSFSPTTNMTATHHLNKGSTNSQKNVSSKWKKKLHKRKKVCWKLKLFITQYNLEWCLSTVALFHNDTTSVIQVHPMWFPQYFQPKSLVCMSWRVSGARTSFGWRFFLLTACHATFCTTS